MKNFKAFKYIKKLVPIIFIFCILATYTIYSGLKSSNKYIASEVIHYNDEQAEKGLAPTGEKLDVNEIKSSAVLSKVVERMGLTGIYSVDSLISRISITPLPDEDKLAQKEAMLEEGEEYIYEPSTFVVSFAAANGEGAEFARKILDETLDVYFAEFSRKYVNVATADNTIENLSTDNYDYIEMMELIDKGIDGTLKTLYQRMEKSPYYHATSTGVSFGDLADDFNYLHSVSVSALFSKIYKHQITKNKSVLFSDYQMRIDENNISNAKEESIVNDIVTVIDAYVEKMRESGNTNITHEYILDELHEKNLTDKNGNPLNTEGDQTVTYDELIYGWRDHNENRKHAIIDSAYSKYVIDTFGKCTGVCKANECAASDKTCTQLHNDYYPQMEKEVSQGIEKLVAELTRLYDLTTKTNDEYNEYLGASYISVLSSSSVKESVNVKLYTLIAFFFIMILCFGGAVIIGRTADIINYFFYTDRITGLNNRAYFDRYLKSTQKKLLSEVVVCCDVNLTNLRDINEKFTRETGDNVLKMFTHYLKDAFGRSDALYIYNGNGSFIIIVNDTDYITAEDIMNMFNLSLKAREEYKEINIEYTLGIAESGKENRTVRKLISVANQNKKTYNV